MKTYLVLTGSRIGMCRRLAWNVMVRKYTARWQQVGAVSGGMRYCTYNACSLYRHVYSTWQNTVQYSKHETFHIVLYYIAYSTRRSMNKLWLTACSTAEGMAYPGYCLTWGQCVRLIWRKSSTAPGPMGGCITKYTWRRAVWRKLTVDSANFRTWQLTASFFHVFQKWKKKIFVKKN